MTKQLTRRWIFAACCLLVALFGVRPASAAAPMCDERGASANAPPPVLAIRDVRLESLSARHCAPPATAIALGTAAARNEATVVADHGVREGWVARITEVRVPAASTRAAPDILIAAPVTAGYRPSVFRPPRQ